MNKDRIKNNFDKMSYNEIIDYVDCLETNYDNLQSKINKANKILDKYAKTEVEDYNKIIKFYKELRNVLKEDK